MQIENMRTSVNPGLACICGEIADNYPWTINIMHLFHQLNEAGLTGHEALRMWADDNLGYRPEMTYGRLFFKDKADALAFKMRWY